MEQMEECRVVSATDPYGHILGFLHLLSCNHEAEWTPFQNHYFSENLAAPGGELGHLDLKPRTLTTRLQRQSGLYYDLITWYSSCILNLLSRRR
jgi:hypothetical protein